MIYKYVFIAVLLSCTCAIGVSSDGIIIHLDPSGNGYVFWESNGDNPAIKMAEYSKDNASWKPAITLSDEDTPSFQPEAVVISDNAETGTAEDLIVAWKSIDTSLGIVSLYSSTSKRNGGWSTPNRVSTQEENISRFSLTAKRNCGACLNWISTSTNANKSVVRNSASADYLHWSEPVTISEQIEQ